ncbi:hypothetical protein HMPREF1051_2638 [Neisseria sicca VK64]|uniref:Uncharacterized protein n=1 Tax=Neisseria sicca VK64 TaxID=1095748 RepID=I2NHI8_NEISI|nr:hypothetical protein HMPREF1051_2638 [Neisseria sicca VK64]
MMAAGLVFIRKRTQKGRLKTNETFAKKDFPPVAEIQTQFFGCFHP